jgi:hypothetical protein
MRWTLLAIAAVAGLAALSGAPPRGAADARVELVDGTLSLQNSLAGQAVFEVEGLAPGHSESGMVTLSNAGTLAGDLSLAAGDVSDTPGPGGGPLSAQLQLSVRNVGAGTTVYSGSLTGMGTLALGSLGPGVAKVYELTASLPASADESVAGASMRVSYTWTASESQVEPPPPGGGGPAPPGGSTDLRAPLRLRVRVPARQPLVRRGQLVAYVRCDQTCWVSGRAQLPAGRGRAVRTPLARSGRVRAGREKRLVLLVPKPRLKVVVSELGKRGYGRVSVTITGRTGEGTRRTVRKRARIAVARSGGPGS